jgi:hypothetical protein
MRPILSADPDAALHGRQASPRALLKPYHQSESRVLPWPRDRVAAPLSRLPVAVDPLTALVAAIGNGPCCGLA